MVRYTDEQREKLFWESIDTKQNNINECWEWQKSTIKQGYGRTSLNGKMILAHRLSFYYTHGRHVSQDKIICHSCDNKKCCNPNHLREGTHKDNSDDMFLRNRFVYMRGEKNGRAKLTQENVETIKRRYKTERISQTQLANEYNVKQTAISKIIRGVSYKSEN
jgi:predicted XRE-type DNA-binding protein